MCVLLYIDNRVARAVYQEKSAQPHLPGYRGGGFRRGPQVHQDIGSLRKVKRRPQYFCSNIMSNSNRRPLN